MQIRVVSPIHYLYDHPRDRLPESIQLETNFFLKKFDTNLVNSVTTEFPELYSKHDIDELMNCHHAAVYEYNDSDHSAWEKQQIKIHRFIESLRLIRPTRASCSTFVFSADLTGVMVPRGASQKSTPIYLVSGGDLSESHFITTDAERIVKYYHFTNHIYEKFGGTYNRVLNAHIFFQLGYMIHYSKLRIVPFVTCLESLFNTSEQEVGYSLRLRCASFLGSTSEEKHDLVERIKQIYQVRSATVHGSSLSKKILRDVEHGNIIMRDSEEICRLCFQKIIDKSLISNFSQDNDKLSEYLDKLLLG